MKLLNLRLGFALRSLALAASLAAVCLVAGAPEAFAAVAHAAGHGAPHDLFGHALTASLTVAALRAKVGELETRATAKEAELKDGLAPEQIRAIEDAHGVILTEIEAARRELETAEEAERAAARAAQGPGAGGAGGDAPAGGADAVASAQVRMGERKRIAEIRLTARKLQLPDAVVDKAIDEGVTIDAFRSVAIDAIASRQNDGQFTISLPASDPAQHRVFAQPKDKLPPGTNASRAMLALAATRGSKGEAAAFVAKHYGREGDVVARALTTSVGTAGGFLVPEEMSTEIIELLRPESAVMALGPNIIPMPNGNFSMGRVSGGALASYVGEAAVIPASQQQFGKMQLSAKKLAALVPLSNDMIRFPSVQIDTVVRNDMIASIAQRADLAFLRGGGTQYSPRGFRALAADPALGGAIIVVATPSPTLDTVTGDLGKAELALANANVKMRKPGWVMSQRTRMYLYNLRNGLGLQVYAEEMDKGMLRGRPFKATTQIPNNLAALDGSGNAVNDASEIYLADFAEVYVGEAYGLELDVFPGGTYTDENGTVVSGISTDETVMRAIVQHDINMRQVAAVAMIVKVRWY